MRLGISDVKKWLKANETYIRFWIYLPIFVYVMVGVSLPVIVIIFSFFDEIKSFVGSPVTYIAKQTPIHGLVYLSIIGVSFYTLKKFQQFWYGFFELLFALYNSFTQFTQIQNQAILGSFQFTIWITTLGTIYLIVRGINNLDDGFKKDFLGKKSSKKFYSFLLTQYENE